MKAKKPAIYNRIVFRIMIPVILVAIIISSLLISFLSPPIDTFLINQFDANLRLASNMGQRICQSYFNYLLELRLEDNAEMNRTLRKEALEEIIALGNQVPGVHLLVFDGDRKTKKWSLDKPITQWEPPTTPFANDSLVSFDIHGDTVKAHILFFPFWDYYITSFAFEKDYLSPITTSHNIIYLSMAGVFATVFITLLFVYYLVINKPLLTLISATQDVSHGKYSPIEKIANNEIGQLMTAFNSMVINLNTEKTEVRNLINQLRISESQLRTLFETAPLGICITSKNGEIIRTNPSIEHMVGLSKIEIKCLNFCDLFENANDGRTLLDDVAVEQSIENFETILIHKDGSNFSVRMILTNILLDKQQAIFAIIEDVTDQKKLESDLLQARKLEAIGSLAGGVAHDFNNLLTPILGYSEILLMNLDQDSKDFTSVKAIWSSADKARGIVRQLLAFSRKQTLEFKTINVNVIILDFFSLLQLTIREDIVIEKLLANSLPSINADPGQIEQVLMNLVVNAQDAMPNGGRLTIETNEIELDASYVKQHKGVLPGQYVMLAISDTGQGIDTKIQAQIFDPFFTTKEKGRGTGFGLATVYGIIKQHNGNIWVYSEPEQGTTFKVYFPVAKTKIEPQEKVLDKILSAKPATETILIVEDDSSVLEMAISILKNENYKILSATSPGDAIQLAHQYNEQIHLLLTDVILPEMNGRELYSRVAIFFPEVKVIYMSGYTDNVIANHGILNEGIVFLQKPFSINNLLAKVRLILDSPKA